MPPKFMIRSDVAPETLDWGQLRWLSNPPTTGAVALTVIDVSLAPGKGHDFHKHPDQEEVLADRRRQRRAVDRPRRSASSAPATRAFVPAGVVHASFNAGAGRGPHRRDPRPLRRRGRLRLGRGRRRGPLEHAPLDRSSHVQHLPETAQRHVARHRRQGRAGQRADHPARHPARAHRRTPRPTARSSTASTSSSSPRTSTSTATSTRSSGWPTTSPATASRSAPSSRRSGAAPAAARRWAPRRSAGSS